ncbi:hypothetical protein D3C81_1230060 [compost metagenome]
MEQAAGRPGDVDRDHRGFVFARQRCRRRGPFGIGQAALLIHAGQPSGGEHDDAAFGLEGVLGGLKRGAGLFAGALGRDPFDRDDGFRQAGRDSQGVGVGEIDQVVAHGPQGVVHGQTVGDAGRVVADHQAAARGGQAVQVLRLDRQFQQV